MTITLRFFKTSHFTCRASHFKENLKETENNPAMCLEEEESESLVNCTNGYHSETIEISNKIYTIICAYSF